MSASCYDKVYDRIGELSNPISEAESDELDSIDNKASTKSSSASATNFSNFDMPPPPSRIIDSNEKNMSTYKKRHIKNQLKEHQDLIDNFISSKTDIVSRSAEAYRHVWEDFIKFSLSIDPKTVSNYIKWKFKLDSSLKDEEIILEGTALKYESILVQFFNYIGYKLHRNFWRKYTSKPNSYHISTDF